MSFLIINETSRFSNVKTRTAMNAKISVFVIYVETIIHLLLYNLHDCTFKNKIENVQYRVCDDAFCNETAVAFLIISAAFFNKVS